MLFVKTQKVILIFFPGAGLVFFEIGITNAVTLWFLFHDIFPLIKKFAWGIVSRIYICSMYTIS